MKNRLTSSEAIDTIEAVGGKYPGFRRAHAKGIGFTGVFKPNGHGAVYTKAKHLKTKTSNAIIRFSDFSPNPESVLTPFSVKGMSVQMFTEQEVITNLVMTSIPVFVSKTPEEFIQLMQVVEKGKMNIKERIETLVQKPEFHVLPEVVANFRTPKSYSNAQFYSIHAFILENELNERQAVKFIWEPLEGEDSLSIFEAIRHNYDFLENEMVEQIDKQPIQFRLMMQLGTEKDNIKDPTQYWSNDRSKIEVGILTIQEQLDDNAESIMFDPTVVPEGIILPDDPVLLFRKGAYYESHKRRISENEEL